MRRGKRNILAHPENKAYAIDIVDADAARLVEMFAQPRNEDIEAAAQEIVIFAP